MNTDEALREFTQSNRQMLTGLEFDKGAYKKACRQFFYEKHKNAFGNPSNSDVARALITQLRKHGIAPEHILEIIDKAPFLIHLQDSTRDELRRLAHSRSIPDVLDPQDLQLVRSVDALEAAKRIHAKTIEAHAQEQLKDINDQIQAKKDEYASLPSVLDSMSVLEPSFQPEVEDNKPWWQRFYLRSDPFPLKDGLSSISQDLYEQVIIRTKPFVDTLSELQRNPNYLFNSGFLLSGGYGYGKTTFIDYLSYILINQSTLPIRLACGRAFSDSAGFADSFFQRLRKELREETRKTSSTAPSEFASFDVEDEIIALAGRLQPRWKGILVFLDDYHKHRSQFPQVLEFLGTLQVLKDNLTRSKVACGFMVSGLPSWKEELARNGQLSGFLDRPPIEMPDITAEMVCDVFNKRISAYCYDRTPRLIKAAFVETLVKELEGKAGLRDYLTKIIAELSNNNHAIVDTPVEISAETLAAIRNRLESDPTLKLAFNKLLFETKFKQLGQQQIVRCLELLVSVTLQNGISEDDLQFRDNSFYFQTLRDCNLIQKQRSRHKGCEWGLAGRLRGICQEIEREYDFGVPDYLLKIYAYPDQRARSQGVRQDGFSELLDLKRLLGRREVRLDKSAHDFMNHGIQLCDAYSFSLERTATDPKHLQRGLRCFESLSLALFELDGSSALFARNSVKDLRNCWELHPYSEDSIGELFARRDDWQMDKSRHHGALLDKQIRSSVRLVLGWLSQLVEDKCVRQEFGLLHRPLSHTEEEILLLREARALAFSARHEDHYDYVKRVTDMVELRLRKFLLVCGSLLFGPRYFDHVPEAVRSYAYKNLGNKENYAVEINLFDGLTRAQLRSILMDRSELQEVLIRPMQMTWKKADWETFTDVFVDYNIKVAHQQIDTFSANERQRYARYCRLAEELLAEMNTTCRLLTERSIYFQGAIEGGNGLGAFRCSFKPPVGFVPDKRGNRVEGEWPKCLAHSFEHQLTEDVWHRVLATVRSGIEASSNGMFIQDMLDTEYIANHFRVTVAEFVLALAYGKQCGERLTVAPWSSSCVAIGGQRVALGTGAN